MRETQENKQSSSGTDTLGVRLRAAREKLGLSVHKTAQDMHVSDDVIEALERNDFAYLGAPIFVRGHLRNYARLLGLPEEEILAAEHTADRLAPPALITQAPSGGHAFTRRFAMPAFSVLIIALLLVLGVIWWLHRPISLPPATLAAQETGSTQKVLTQAPLAASQPLITTRETRTPAMEKAAKPPEMHQHHELATTTAAEQIHQARVNSAPMQPAVHARSRTVSPNAVAGTAPIQLVYARFVVSQPSWIEVYDASGKRLYYDLAPAGDKFNVSGAGPLQVFLGNAPGVSIDLNGAPFNLAPFTHPDNTARFRLGAAAGSGDPTG